MSPIHDPGGKPSLGRVVILIAVLAMIVGTIIHNADLTKVGAELLTTFLGWEARKHHADSSK